MFMAVYFNSRLSTPRDEIEDLIEQRLGGKGEVTGGGTGLGGSNIDIEVEDDVGAEEALRLVRAVLQEINTAKDTEITIEDQTFPLYE
jgi:hypothetical protein